MSAAEYGAGKMDAGKVISCILIAAAFAGGFALARRCSPNPPHGPISPKVDTLIVRDTFVQTTPIYVTKRVVEKVLVPVTDTLHLHDTTYVQLDREQVEWSDSLATVWASGILPQVDSVRHYTSTVYITKEVPVEVKVRPRWSLGVTAGYGAGKDGLTPFVGAGITYNVLTFGRR